MLEGITHLESGDGTFLASADLKRSTEAKESNFQFSEAKVDKRQVRRTQVVTHHMWVCEPSSGS